MILIVAAFIISSMMVAYMLPHILILSLRKRLVDPIDPRKVHNVPASRLGGLTFFPAILFSSWFCMSAAMLFMPYFGYVIDVNVEMIVETLSLLLLFLVGVYDDVIGVTYKRKFLVQIAAATLIVASGTYFTTFHGFCGIDTIPAYVGMPLTVLFYVFVTNAINLIDGIDGLASLLSIMALFVYGMLLYNSNMMADSLIAIATLGALVPFCYANVFGIKRGAKSKIFMGDTGALVVGAILGFTMVSLWNITYDEVSGAPIDHIYYILAYTMLIIPCLDVLRIILHRYRIHKPIFQPDKNHFHHKFMALGLSPHRALGYIIFVNVLFIAINVLLSFVLNFTYILIIDIVLWIVMHLVLSKRIALYKERRTINEAEV